MSVNPRPSSFYPRPNSSSNVNTNITSLNASTQSSALQARINAKRAELQNLQALRDLSATLATQMGELESKLATLRDGAEAVGVVLANWENVLSAIRMASSKAPQLLDTSLNPDVTSTEPDSSRSVENDKDTAGRQPTSTRKTELPVTLVRIPVTQQKESGTV